MDCDKVCQSFGELVYASVHTEGRGHSGTEGQIETDRKG